MKTNFKEFLELLSDKPEYARFLSDGGKGDAPMELLESFENGCRAAAQHRQTIFATYSIASPKRWMDSDETWRHRQCYYHIVRLVEKSRDLKAWSRLV